MGIFNPENGFFRVTGKLVDLVILSAFWLFCSLPVVTVGPATAALYHTVVRCIRGNERDSWMLFFRTFKSNLKVGVLTSLVVIPRLPGLSAAAGRGAVLCVPCAVPVYVWCGGPAVHLWKAGHCPSASYDMDGAPFLCGAGGVLRHPASGRFAACGAGLGPLLLSGADLQALYRRTEAGAGGRGEAGVTISCGNKNGRV